MSGIFDNKSMAIIVRQILLLVMIFFIAFGVNKKIFSLSRQTSSTAQSFDTSNLVTTQKETVVMENNSNSHFWLNSGGLLYNQNSLWHTVLGDLPTDSSWRKRYAVTNPRDTDNGYHPQNIFRLITKSAYKDNTESVYVLIVQDNISQSPNRNDSNGIFLINRYQDPNNLYYAGIRVDGTAVIKKKIDGVYHTLAQTSIFEGDEYDRITNPSLLPKNQWIGLNVTVHNTSSNVAQIVLSLDKNNSGTWTEVLSVYDSLNGDIQPILTSGHGGIRSDFMDIEFRDFIFTPFIYP